MSDKEDAWYRDNHEAMDRLSVRTLDTSCPEAIGLLESGQNVLDLGCGPGGITIDIGHRIAPGAVTGVDLSRLAIERANDLAVARGARCRFILADGNDLPFGAGSFDGVICVHAIGLLRDPEIGLRKIRSIIAPGGWIFFNTADREQNKILYPDCPTLLHCESKLMNASRPDAVPWGRASLDYLRRSGFVDCRMSVNTPPEHYQYVDQSIGYNMVDGFRDMLGMNGESDYPLRKLVGSGSITPDELARARNELEMFQHHPSSYYAQITFNAQGRVPSRDSV